MVIIFVLLTFALFITINLLLKSRKTAKSVSFVRDLPKVPFIEPTERFFHPGHSWAMVHADNLVTVGIDNFTQRFLGKLDGIDLPPEGSPIRQGDPLVTLRRGNKAITLVSPVSGLLSGINRSLSSHPELVNEAPYGDGWIVKISPTHLPLELKNLMRGITASVWREALRVQLVQWFTPRLGPVLQDGGKLVDNISALVSDDEWSKLVGEFFPADFQSDQLNLKPLK